MPEALHAVRFGTAGPEVLLIHGFCETAAIWNPWANQLTNLCVTAIDLPGFGNSPLPPEPITLETVAGTVIEYLQKQGSRPVVVGHSLGGYVALAMAEQAPELLSGLVLFHSTPYPDSADRKVNRNKAIEFVSEHGVKPFTQTLVPNLFFQKDLAAVQTARQLAETTPQTTVLAYLAAMRDRPDRSGVFKRFRGKKAVLGGVNDALIPIESLRQLAKEDPASGLEEFENIGHMGMFEAPGATAQAVARVASTF
jgi:pimeloyl-ACP methyl ester carboxylesterase